MAIEKRRARGTGSIFYSESRGVWVGRVPFGQSITKRTRYRETSAPTQTALVAKLARLEPPSAKITVSQWADRWIDSLSVRSSTRDCYEVSVRLRIQPVLGHIRLSDLTPAQIEEAARRWAAGLSANTVRLTVTHLHSCLSAAIRAGVLDTNPAKVAKKPRSERKTTRPFTPADLARVIVEALRRPPARLIAILAATGCRIGEAVALEVTDFTPETGMLTISKTCHPMHGLGPPKSQHGYRTIRVPASALPAIHAARAGRKAGPLFATGIGTRNSAPLVARSWRRVLKALELPYRNMHTLRHSIATAMISVGVPLGDVAKYLGDGVSTIVANYLHPANTDPTAALDELLGGTSMDGESGAKQKPKGL